MPFHKASWREDGLSLRDDGARGGKGRRNRINYGALFVSLSVLVYAMFFYFNGALENSDTMADIGLIPFDSLHYVIRGEEMNGVQITWLQVLLGAFNWLSLSYLYSVFQTNFSSGGLFFVFVNVISLYVALNGAVKIFSHGRIARQILPIFILALMPFIWGWSLAPNKELLIGALLIIILRKIIDGRLWPAFFLSLLAASLKIQLLIAIAIFVIFYRLKFRKTLSLVFVSLVLPFILPLHAGLTMEQFLENQVDEIGTAAFFSYLDNINKYPFGFLLVAPIRLLANLLGGVSPNRLFMYSSFEGIMAPLTSFFLAVLSILLFYSVIKKRHLKTYFRSQTDWSFYLHCVVMSLCLVPFLQPRYYWWAIPVMLCFLFSKKANADE